MMMRLSIAAGALMLGATPLPAQADAPAPAAALRAPSAGTFAAPVLDPRLIVDPEQRVDATRPAESEAWRDVVARPWWHYPAIGAVIGAAAGAVHAHAITRGDYVGLPVEPMYVLPPAYGAVGAFLGLLIDSAERERAARRRG